MARLTRWGNSNGGLRVPKHILEAAELKAGDEIGFRLLDNGTILLTPRKQKLDISQEQLKIRRQAVPVAKW